MRLKPLGTRSELTAQRILWRALADTDWNVCPQVSLQSVFAKEKWLSPSEFSLLASGSLDFLITDSNGLAIFAIEFDGFGHDDPRQVERDLIKNSFCATAGLPLLRIGADELKEREETSVLEWLCNAFAAAERELDEALADDSDDDFDDASSEEADDANGAAEDDVLGEPGIEMEHPFLDNALVASRLLERHGIGLGDAGSFVMAPDAARYILDVRWPGRQPPKYRLGRASEFVVSEREFLVVERDRPKNVLFSGVGRAEFAWAHKMPVAAGGQNPLVRIEFPWDALGVAMELAESSAVRQVEAWAQRDLIQS